MLIASIAKRGGTWEGDLHTKYLAEAGKGWLAVTRLDDWEERKPCRLKSCDRLKKGSENLFLANLLREANRSQTGARWIGAQAKNPFMLSDLRTMDVYHK
jgi:hypothetical protein